MTASDTPLTDAMCGMGDRQFVPADFARTLERRLRELEQAAEYAYEMLEWHTDDDADENNTSPDDAHAHINGLVRQRLRAALAQKEGL